MTQKDAMELYEAFVQHDPHHLGLAAEALQTLVAAGAGGEPQGTMITRCLEVAEQVTPAILDGIDIAVNDPGWLPWLCRKRGFRPADVQCVQGLKRALFYVRIRVRHDAGDCLGLSASRRLVWSGCLLRAQTPTPAGEAGSRRTDLGGTAGTGIGAEVRE